MKKVSITFFVSLLGVSPVLWAQTSTASESVAPDARVGVEPQGKNQTGARPTVGSGPTRSQETGDSSPTSGVSGPDDGPSENASDSSSGSSGGSGTSGSGSDEERQGPSSAQPEWQGLGSTGGATGTGETIGTTNDNGTSGASGSGNNSASGTEADESNTKNAPVESNSQTGER